MPMVRRVQDVQLSGNGYRKNPDALKPARDLWSAPPSTAVKKFARLADSYENLAASCTRGTVTYGPQGGSNAKKAIDASLNFELMASRISSATEPELDLNDLKTVRDWKMVRNRARQNWLLVDSNSESLCREATKKAFKSLDQGEWEDAMKILTDSLHGVGPATASAVLALRDDSVPFMSEESIRVSGVSGHPQPYSVAAYKVYHSMMNEKATELSSTVDEKKNVTVTARDVERAIWAATYEQHYSDVAEDRDEGENTSNKKRRIT